MRVGEERGEKSKVVERKGRTGREQKEAERRESERMGREQ